MWLDRHYQSRLVAAAMTDRLCRQEDLRLLGNQGIAKHGRDQWHTRVVLDLLSRGGDGGSVAAMTVDDQEAAQAVRME